MKSNDVVNQNKIKNWLLQIREKIQQNFININKVNTQHEIVLNKYLKNTIGNENDKAEIQVLYENSNLHVFILQQGKKPFGFIMPYTERLAQELCDRLIKLAMANKAPISSSDEDSDNFNITEKNETLPIYLSAIESLYEKECLLKRKTS